MKPECPQRFSSWLVIALFFWICLRTEAQFIKDIRLSGGSIIVEQTSKAAAYYVLLQGTSVSAIHTPRDMEFGIDGSVLLFHRNLPGFASFYRVREVPRALPVDSD